MKSKKIARLTFCCLANFCFLCVFLMPAVAQVTIGTLGNEPLVQVAPDNTIYVTALQHLYRSTDNGATWTKLNYPLFSAVVASDSSISIDPLGRLYLAFDYPYAGTTATCTTDDKGNTWSCNPSVIPGGTDRMWIAAPSSSEAFVVTNEGLYETVFSKSTDRGTTWLPNQLGSSVLEPQTGPLFRKPGSQNVLQIIKTEDSQLSLYVFSPNSTGSPLSAIRSTGLSNPYALPSVSLDKNGAIYVATETANAQSGRQIVVARSSDEGLNWQQLPPIPQTMSGTSTFAWIAAGSPGHIGVIYYYTPDNGDPSLLTTSKWSTYWAETYNANTANPIWKVQAIESDIHTGAVCVAASCTGNGRFAGDFISSFIDANNNSHLVWMRDDKSVRYQRIPASVTTAASATIGGRVITAGNRGVSKVRIKLTKLTGETRFTVTDSKGFYSFGNAQTGTDYVVTASSNIYGFVNTQQIVNFNGDKYDVNFEAKMLKPR